MKRSAPERYALTLNTLKSLLAENPNGVYITAKTLGEMQDPIDVTYRGATREELLDPNISPMPIGVTSIRRLQEFPPIQEITVFVGPPAPRLMPLGGLPLPGVDERFFDNAVHQLTETAERQRRQSA